VPGRRAAGPGGGNRASASGADPSSRGPARAVPAHGSAEPAPRNGAPPLVPAPRSAPESPSPPTASPGPEPRRPVLVLAARHTDAPTAGGPARPARRDTGAVGNTAIGGGLDDPAVGALLCALRAQAGAEALPRDIGGLLYSLVRVRRPGVTVDHGGAWPDTAVPLAAAVRDNGSGHLVCRAPGRSAAGRTRAWLERAGLTPWARVLGPFADLAASLPGPLDLLVLRGRPDTWRATLELLEPMMRPGTQVVAGSRHALPDDYLHRVRSSGRYLSLALPIGDGLEVSSRLAHPSRATLPPRTDPGTSS
ncbi:class I SAM-dependent methyltransferase, partial [Streptomyces fuscigenes]|uniref:class I SAM-dependent methyltransferase n=1 Tax=Streptomyces fuscigenes TaxID=1528880 RepID=UPI001F36AE3E